MIRNDTGVPVAVSRQIRAFYLHVSLFVIVNIILHLINFLAAPRTYWAFWPLLG